MLDTIGRILLVVAEVLTGIFWGIIALVGLAILILVVYTLLKKPLKDESKDEYESLPDSVKAEAIRLIEQACSEGSSCRLLIPDPLADKSSPTFYSGSRLGGPPYLPASFQHAHSKDKFLLQVRIDEPSLGEVWQGRIIKVDLDSDAVPVAYNFTALQGIDDRAAIDCSAATALRPLPLPTHRLRECASPEFQEELADPDSGGPGWYNTKWLLRAVPGLRDLVSPYAPKDQDELLARIIQPGYRRLEDYSVLLCGGTPVLMHGAHDARCPTCGQTLRFLFQFGDELMEESLGDGGVASVYGCDNHPEYVLVITDSH